jgi:hypothetical protein
MKKSKSLSLISSLFILLIVSSCKKQETKNTVHVDNSTPPIEETVSSEKSLEEVDKTDSDRDGIIDSLDDYPYIANVPRVEIYQDEEYKVDVLKNSYNDEKLFRVKSVKKMPDNHQNIDFLNALNAYQNHLKYKMGQEDIILGLGGQQTELLPFSLKSTFKDAHQYFSFEKLKSPFRFSSKLNISITTQGNVKSISNTLLDFKMVERNTYKKSLLKAAIKVKRAFSFSSAKRETSEKFFMGDIVFQLPKTKKIKSLVLEKSVLVSSVVDFNIEYFNKALSQPTTYRKLIRTVESSNAQIIIVSPSYKKNFFVAPKMNLKEALIKIMNFSKELKQSTSETDWLILSNDAESFSSELKAEKTYVLIERPQKIEKTRYSNMTIFNKHISDGFIKKIPNPRKNLAFIDIYLRYAKKQVFVEKYIKRNFKGRLAQGGMGGVYILETGAHFYKQKKLKHSDISDHLPMYFVTGNKEYRVFDKKLGLKNEIYFDDKSHQIVQRIYLNDELEKSTDISIVLKKSQREEDLCFGPCYITSNKTRKRYLGNKQFIDHIVEVVSNGSTKEILSGNQDIRPLKDVVSGSLEIVTHRK